MKHTTKIKRQQLLNKASLLHKKLSENIQESHCSGNVEKWLKGITNILESRTLLNSNIDDILWFQSQGLSRKDKILDFGAGSGYVTYLLSQECDDVNAYEYNGSWTDQNFTNDDYYEAFSISQKTVNALNNNIQFKFYKTLPLNEGESSYDGIVLYAVIEHIDTTVQDAVFTELKRLLKPGGLLYIAKLPRILSYQEYIARKLGMGSHSNLFTDTKIRKLLQNHGFKIIKIEKTGMFFNHPNKYTNLIFPVTERLEKVLGDTPLNSLAHDYRLIAQRM